MQVAHELDQMLQLLAHLGRQRIVARIFHQAHQLAGLADTLAADDTELGQVPAQGVDLHGLLLDQELPDPMQLGHGLLLDRLHRDKAHGRAGHRLADRLGIGGVMLVGLHVGFDALLRHEPDLMAQLAQLAGPMVGAGAGLHADQAWRQVGEELEHLAPG